METHTKPIEVIFTDDDEDDLEFFRKALARIETPTNLTTFRDAEKLIKYLERKKSPPQPDIIFLDINMPRKDGLSCLRDLRGNPQFKSIPIIMFTTSLRPLDVEQSYQRGANLYIRKPPGFEEWVSTMQKLFSKQWLGRLVNAQQAAHIYRPDIPDKSNVYNPILSPDI